MKGFIFLLNRCKGVLPLLLIFMNSSSVYANVAKAILLRGEVKTKDKDSETVKAIHQNDWVNEGAVIQTGPKSFVKLLFTDKTQMNLGPDSKMVINKFPQNQPGLISLVKGKLRAEVVKDALAKSKEGDENKLYIRTQSAAMGIRGTDLQTTYNEENKVTSLLTFRGEVAMVQTPADFERAVITYNILREALTSEGVVKVKEGQFSGANPQQERATIPVKISPAQLETLKSNTTMEEKRGGGEGKEEGTKKTFQSMVPPGINPKSVMNITMDLGKQLTNTVGKDFTKGPGEGGPNGGGGGPFIPPPKEPPKDAPPPEGFYNAKTGAFAPPAGGFLDLKTGLYVPPPPGSTFDPNTQVYVPPPSVGKFDPATGNYVPPAGFKLEADGHFAVDNAQPKDRPKENRTDAPAGDKGKPGDKGPVDARGGSRPGEGPVGPPLGTDGKPLPPPPPSVAMSGNQFVPPDIPTFRDPQNNPTFNPYILPPPGSLPPPIYSNVVDDLEKYRNQTFEQQQQQQQQQNSSLGPTTNVNFIINVQ